MLWADLLSLARIPLGLAFLLVASQRTVALMLIAIAAATDVLDGYVARKAMGATRPANHRGDWLDPLCDKIFLLFVLLGLVWVHGTPLLFLLVLLLREALQVVALAIFAAVPSLHRQPYNYRANRLGKLTTVLQFCTALMILLGQPPPWPLAILTATLGVISLATYIARVRVAAQVGSETKS